MNPKKLLNAKRARRAGRVRARIFGSAERPRLSVLRSNKNISAQLIDDDKGHTLAHISVAEFASDKNSKTDKARKAGEAIAKKAKELGVSRVVFDRRHYRYHGRVKAFVEGARSGGLKV